MEHQIEAGEARAAEVEAALAAFERPEASGRRQLQKIRYTHDAMIDLMIMRPEISQRDLAEIFGFTEPWVSQVINSDMFQARLALRKEQVIDPTIRLTVTERFRAVTNRSLDILQEKLSKPAAQVPDNLVLKAVEIGAKALAVGGNAPPAQPSTDHLAGLADRLLALQSRARRQYLEVHDAEVHEVRPYDAYAEAKGAEGEYAQTQGPAQAKEAEGSEVAVLRRAA